MLERYGVRVLGTPIKSIRDTEDRQLFIERLNEIGVKTARSRACRSLADARAKGASLIEINPAQERFDGNGRRFDFCPA